MEDMYSPAWGECQDLLYFIFLGGMGEIVWYSKDYGIVSMMEEILTFSFFML